MGALRAVDTPQTQISDESLATANKVFQRYDLDDSGTLNSIEEAQQMTMYMLFSMGYAVKPEVADAAVSADLKDVEQDPMDFDRYFEYFINKFGLPPNELARLGLSPKPKPSGGIPSMLPDGDSSPGVGFGGKAGVLPSSSEEPAAKPTKEQARRTKSLRSRDAARGKA